MNVNSEPGSRTTTGGGKGKTSGRDWPEEGCGATSLDASSNPFNSLRPEPASFVKKAQKAAESATMGALVAGLWLSEIYVLRPRNDSPCARLSPPYGSLARPFSQKRLRSQPALCPDQPAECSVSVCNVGATAHEGMAWGGCEN